MSTKYGKKFYFLQFSDFFLVIFNKKTSPWVGAPYVKKVPQVSLYFKIK